jgi:hypothetical protein
VGEGTHLVAIGVRAIRDDGATEGDRCELGELGVGEVDNVGELRRKETTGQIVMLSDTGKKY